MKTVICIDEGNTKSIKPELAVLCKGSEYIITQSVIGPNCTYKGESSNIWYYLLETGILRHSSLLFSDPVDIEDTIEIEAEILN